MTHSANWQIATYCKSRKVVQLYLYTTQANKRAQTHRRRDASVSFQAHHNPQKGEPLAMARNRGAEHGSRERPGRGGHFPGAGGRGGVSPNAMVSPRPPPPPIFNSTGHENNKLHAPSSCLADPAGRAAGHCPPPARLDAAVGPAPVPR